jgi:predicted dehydrogenase
MNNSKRLRWGLIGASNIAKTYMINAINAQPDSEVVAVLSSSPERATSKGLVVSASKKTF